MIIGATLGTLKNISRLKEQLFFMLDTGVKEFMEVCQLLPNVSGLSNCLIIHDGGIKVLNKFLP